MKTFKELNLAPSLGESLDQMGFNEPTPIQAQAIPVVMKGQDIVGLAQTGTGKTAAFGIPMIQMLIEDRDASALILVPTRELANQVSEVLRDLTKNNPEMRVVCLIGGMSMQAQTRQVQKGFRIIVATPGRLLDHLGSRSGLLSRLKMLVLDEADRMLDMGFDYQLQQIYRHLPKERQTLLFSATIPAEIAKLAQKMLRNPTTVRVGEISKPISKIAQKARRVNGDAKNDMLLDEINAREGTILVFIRTQRRTDRVAKFLDSYGLKVARIHGGRSQGQRNSAIQGFKGGDFRILVATDIAARGLDITHVAHVINYDLPQVPEDYVHRIGRTARNGRNGESMSFISSDEVDQWRAIETLLKRTNSMPQVENAIPGAKNLRDAPRPQRPQQQQRPARRPQMPSVQERQQRQRAYDAPRPREQAEKKAFPKNIRFKQREPAYS